MKDGLYIVHNKNLCAGFVVRYGHITECAPILRKRIDYWKRVAKRIATDQTVRAASSAVTPGPSRFSGGGK